VKAPSAALALLGLLSACAARQPDHFYILNPQPPGVNAARAPVPTQVTLRVTLPSLVDRSEMVLNTSSEGVTVLEHERWAAPLDDLVTQTLARDMERRRGDMLITNRAIDGKIKIIVDVVQMTVRRGQQASIEAHWRITDADTGKNSVGGDVFSAPLGQEGYAAVAQALSDCVGLLADRLVAEVR
jgi:uncharacterized lipoprotein YmbA